MIAPFLLGLPLLCIPACDPEVVEIVEIVEPVGVIVAGVAVKATAKDRRLARLQFTTYCAGCHGKYGRGDGPSAKNMIPKPRNWTDTSWQKSVTDERLFQVIRYGGAKFGLSPLMAANPQYEQNPGVLTGLVEIVRSFGD